MHIWNFSNFRQLDNVTRLPTGTTDLNMEFVIAYSPCDVCDKVIGKNVPFKNHRTVNHDFELFQFQTWQCYKIVHKDKRSNMELDICLLAVSDHVLYRRTGKSHKCWWVMWCLCERNESQWYNLQTTSKEPWAHVPFFWLVTTGKLLHIGGSREHKAHVTFFWLIAAGN